MYNKKIPRQAIYQMRLFRSYLRCVFGGADACKRILTGYLYSMTRRKPLFLGRARTGIYLAVKISVAKCASSPDKKVCLMSPLTILDLANMVSAAKAEPEYYDFLENSFELDIEYLSKRIARGDIAAVIVTHYFGIDPKIIDLVKICTQYKVNLIEDCAISIGANKKGIYAGNYGDFSVYSFSIFKFLNFLWGGAMLCKSEHDYHTINSEVSQWQKLDLLDYFPQFTKYVKFGLATFRPIFEIIFYIFRYGLRNNLKVVKNNIQNDPYVPFSSNMESTCFSQPHNWLFCELGTKVSSVLAEASERRIKALNIHEVCIKHKVSLLPDTMNYTEFAFINYPVLMPTKAMRDRLLDFLLKEGVDCATQLYRNLKSVDGYCNINGCDTNISRMLSRLVFIPIHSKVDFNSAFRITGLLDSFFKQEIVPTNYENNHRIKR